VKTDNRRHITNRYPGFVDIFSGRRKSTQAPDSPWAGLHRDSGDPGLYTTLHLGPILFVTAPIAWASYCRILASGVPRRGVPGFESPIGIGLTDGFCLEVGVESPSQPAPDLLRTNALFPIMVFPQFHSFTWSDSDEVDPIRPGLRPNAPGDHLGLKDKELFAWVTYPEGRQGRNQKKCNGSKRRSRKLKLWAVLIVEGVKKLDQYAYEIDLRRVYKKSERFITIEVINDPADQSEDAGVYRVVHPRPTELDPFEQRLAVTAAKRVYYAIAETWSGSQPAFPGEKNDDFMTGEAVPHSAPIGPVS
jgi:hypothetical protein